MLDSSSSFKEIKMKLDNNIDGKSYILLKKDELHIQDTYFSVIKINKIRFCDISFQFTTVDKKIAFSFNYLDGCYSLDKINLFCKQNKDNLDKLNKIIEYIIRFHKWHHEEFMKILNEIRIPNRNIEEIEDILSKFDHSIINLVLEYEMDDMLKKRPGWWKTLINLMSNE